MSQPIPDAREIFLAALEFQSPESLTDYLDKACGENVEVRQRVECLLQANVRAGNFLGGIPGCEATVDSPAVNGLPFKNVGPYKLLQRIGEGGMGTVFLAEQSHPIQRKIALKLIRSDLDSRQTRARFEAERQALAMMEHPNIARVFDAGATDSGQLFFVMELVQGIPITRYCDQHRLSPRERLALFLPICQAVQHAHQKGIIHRDLKPSNVLVAICDGRATPKVIDFGVAKALDHKLTDKTVFTEFGAFVGTLEYMSPEQAHGSPQDVDTRSDIYSLGVMLYELLTGTTPLDRRGLKNAAILELLRIIKDEEPPRPSTRLSTTDALPSIAANRGLEPKKLSGLVRGELDWIVMKALEKDRSRRYETAHSLAADVQRYLEDEPVAACPPSTAYRLRKFARRHLIAMTTTAIVAGALVLGMGISTLQAIRASKAEVWAEKGWAAEKAARTKAVHAEQAERDARRLAQRKLFDARLAQARARRKSNAPGQRIDSLLALNEATELADHLNLGPSIKHELRNEAIACLGLPDLSLLHEQPAAIPDFVNAAEFDPSLEHYAVGDTHGQIVIRRLDNNKEVIRLSCPMKTDYRSCFSPNGQLLAAQRATAGSNSLVVWDWRKGKIIFETDHGLSYWTGIAFSPDSRRLAIGMSKQVSVFDLTTQKKVWQIATAVSMSSLAISPNGDRIALGSRDARPIVIHDLATEALLHKFDSTHPTYALAWHSDGERLAVSGFGSRSIQVWDVASGQTRSMLNGHQSGAWFLSFAPGTDLLMSTSWDRTVRIWNVVTGREEFRMPGTFCNWSHDARRLAVLDFRQVKVWERAKGQAYQVLIGGQAQSLSRDGRWLTVLQPDGVSLVDLIAGKQAALLPIRRSLAASFHPSDDKLFTSGASELYYWPFQSDTNGLRIGPPHRLASNCEADRILGIQDKALLLCGSQRTGAAILGLEQPDAAPLRLNHSNSVYGALSPDGRWAVTGNHNGFGVRVIDVATGQLIRQLLPDERTVRVGFHSDGRQIVTSSLDRPDVGTIWWDVASWDELRRIPDVGPFAWSADGRVFAQRSAISEKVRLWDGNGQRELAMLDAPDDGQLGNTLLFTPDGGQLIVTGDEPSRTCVWNLRLVREQLAKMGLDWDAPPYPKESTIKTAVGAPKIDLQLVNPSEKPTREREEQGDTHRTRNEYTQAIACYRDVLKTEPYNALIMNRLVWLLSITPSEVRDVQDALKLGERCRAWNPTNAYYLNTFALAQYRAGQHAEALRSLQQVERQLGDNKSYTWPQNWLVQALCLARLGQREASRAVYHKSVEWLKDHEPSSFLYSNESELLRREAAALLDESK